MGCVIYILIGMSLHCSICYGQLTISKSTGAPMDADILLGFDTDQASSQNLLLWDRGQNSETFYGQTFRFDRPTILEKIRL
jgi:hypothetical protein